MSVLFIVGNGFDLWHRLPTSYKHFHEFSRGALEEIENFYDSGVGDATPWCDFENRLGTFNSEYFYETHNEIDPDAEDFRTSFVFGLADDLNEQADQIVETITDCFQDWISSIDISTANRRVALPYNAKYLNFNYTSTLESTYGIKECNVLHIHGRAGTSDDLVFGHGATIEEEPELDEAGESNRTIFSEAKCSSNYPIYALRKPVDEIIKKYNKFFESIEETSEIAVVGHSLNRIDLPYFRRVAEQARNSRWTVYLYEQTDSSRCLDALFECGVPRERVDFRTYKDLENKYPITDT